MGQMNGKEWMGIESGKKRVWEKKNVSDCVMFKYVFFFAVRPVDLWKIIQQNDFQSVFFEIFIWKN